MTCVHRGHCESWFKEDVFLDRKELRTTSLQVKGIAADSGWIDPESWMCLSSQFLQRKRCFPRARSPRRAYLHPDSESTRRLHDSRWLSSTFIAPPADFVAAAFGGGGDLDVAVAVEVGGDGLESVGEALADAALAPGAVNGVARIQR